MNREEAGSPTETTRILERRAIALARLDNEELDGDILEMVVVRCGRETYGIETRWIQEIQLVEHLTPVPRALGTWAGVMNLRGVIHGVIDATRYLGLEQDRSDSPRVVLVGSAEDTIGFLVDEVLRLERVPADELRPPVNMTSSRAPVVRAVTPAMVPLIDVEVILNDPFLRHEN